MTFTGACRCGATRYEVAVDSLTAIYCCHCTDCQRWSGSSFSEQAVVPEAAISATGPVIEFTVTNESGALSHQRVCGACHNRLWNTNSSRPGIAIIRAGTLDHNRTLEPRAYLGQEQAALGDDRGGRSQFRANAAAGRIRRHSVAMNRGAYSA